MKDVVTQIYQIMHQNGNIARVQLEFDGKEVVVNTSVVTPPPPPEPRKVYEFKQLCPFCSHALDEELFNGVYGCDTGCEYVRMEIECPNCHKVAWDSGSFGSYDNKEEKAEYRAEFMDEFAKWLQDNKPERLTQANPKEQE